MRASSTPDALDPSRLHRISRISRLQQDLEGQETRMRQIDQSQIIHCQMPVSRAYSMHCLLPMRRQADARG